MAFGLYERGHDDDVFIRVLTRNSHEFEDESYAFVEGVAVERKKRQADEGGPIADQRIVAAQSTSDLPLTAEESTLTELINENNDMYPRGGVQ